MHAAQRRTYVSWQHSTSNNRLSSLSLKITGNRHVFVTDVKLEKDNGDSRLAQQTDKFVRKLAAFLMIYITATIATLIVNFDLRP